MKADSDRQQQFHQAGHFNGVNGVHEMNGQYYEGDNPHLKGLRVGFENTEESLRSMQRHNSSSVGEVKGDTMRQMHAYKNAVSKFRNHINIVERENHALKRQISSIASQTINGDVSNGDMASMSRHTSHTTSNEKAQLEDIRATCMMLSERIKRMEEQNNVLLVNAEKQRGDYERCLDKVTSQVFQALSCQRRLQVECDALRMQVHHLNGNRSYPVHTPILSRSEDSPQNGRPSTGSSVSEDPFSPTVQGNDHFSYRQWQGMQTTFSQGENPQAVHPAMVTGQTTGQQYSPNEVQYGQNINPRIQYMDNSPQMPCMNPYQSQPMSPRDPANHGNISNYPLENQFERLPVSPYRLQPTRSPPLHAIPESIEPPISQRNGSNFRPRLTRSGSEILTRKPYAEMTQSRVAHDDESVGRVSRSRDSHRSNDRSKVARSRSFDEHSINARNDVNRPQQGISPMRYAPQNLQYYRPGPALNSPPAAMKNSFPMTSPQNVHPMTLSTPKMNHPQNISRQACGYQSVNVNVSDYDVQSKANADQIVANSQNVACSSQNIPPVQPQQSKIDCMAREQYRRACSQEPINAIEQETNSNVFSRGAVQRSFRVTRSCERRHEQGKVSDDVWLPRSGGSTEPISFRLQPRKKSQSQIEDLPPPPPPPPTDEQYLEMDTEKIDQTEEADIILPRTEVIKRNETTSEVKEESSLKKQALAKREAYSAACRISQSLDHLANLEVTVDASKAPGYGTYDSSSKTEVGVQNRTQSPIQQNYDGASVKDLPDSRSSPQQKSPSQLQAPKSRILKKSTKREAPKHPPIKNNQSETSEDNLQQTRMAPASSCETLISSNTSSHDVARRMSEGMVRGLSKKSRLAAPSNKRSVPNLGKNDSQTQDKSVMQLNKDEKNDVAAPPLPPKLTSPPSGEIETSVVSNLPGNRTALSSLSYHNITSDANDKRSPTLATSQPNLTRLARINSEHKSTKVLSETNLAIENTTNIVTHSAALKNEYHSTRSQSEEPRSRLSKPAAQSKLAKRSQSSDRTNKKNLNQSTKKDEINSKTEKKNENKKKNGSQKTFVNIMKSRFGGKSHNSTNKKTSTNEKSDVEVRFPLSVTTVIDPRTLSLEPNSIPPSKNASTQDLVGRKLSQPFLHNSTPSYTAGTGLTKSDSGQKKSFLGRHNSKRNKGLRHGAFDNGEHFNNHPFGRVELIPVGAHPMATTDPDHMEYDNLLKTPQLEDGGLPQTNCEFTKNTACNSKIAQTSFTNHNISPNVRRRQNDYENVILVENDNTDVTRELTSHNYENVVIVNANTNEPMPEKSNTVVLNKLPKQTSSLKKIWGSLSNHSLNKMADSEHGSRTALHQIGGVVLGRCISGEGNPGTKSKVYADEQRMFEKVFISSVVEAELQQQKDSNGGDHDNTDVEFSKKNQAEYCRSIPEDENTEGARNISAQDYSSQTESGKSSMTFSTTSSSKSGNSSFDSWPSKYVDTSPKIGGRKGGSLDARYRDIKSIEEIEAECGRSYLQSRRHVGNSHSSLGSFGYGSGVSSSSTSSSNKSSLHRGRSPLDRNPKDQDEDPIVCSPQDSSSDNDLTPTQQPSSLQQRFAARKFSTPIGSKLQTPQKLSRLKCGVSPGRVKMGVSSISSGSYSPEITPEHKPKKLAPLNYGFVSPPTRKATNVTQIPTKQSAATKTKESRKTGLPCRTAANVPIPSRAIPQSTGIPNRYVSSRQQQHAR